MSLRGWLYWMARTLGDLNAIVKGRFLQRLARRTALAKTAGLVNRLFR